MPDSTPQFTTCRLLLAITLVVVAACNNGDSSEEHIARAKQYFSQEQHEAATIELKNALQQDGNSAQARWLLGAANLKSGDALAAEKDLLRAQELGWDINEVRPTLAQALYLQRKNAAVLSLAHEGMLPTATAQLLSTKALAELALGETEKARVWIAFALELQPDSVDAKMAEARLLATQSDRIGALIVLEEVIGEDAGHPEAYSLKGTILLSQKNLDEALAAFDKSIALSPSAHTDRLKRALINLDKKNYDAARDDVETVLQAVPHQPFGNYLQGLLHFQNGQYKEAISALSQAEPAAQQMPAILFYLGGAHLMEGNPNQAADFAQRFVNAMPDNIEGRKLLATSRLQQGKYTGVVALIEPVLATNPNDLEALNLMANALMSDGETDQGINYLTQIAQLQPDSATAQVKLGLGFLMGGRADDATRHIQAAVDLDPELQQADVLLILSHFQKKDYDKAIDLAKAYQDEDPDSVTPLNLLGKIYLASDRRQQAIDSFEEALTIDPGDPAANRNLAQLAQAEGDLALARTHYEATLKHHPDYLSALLQLAFVDAMEQKEEAMVTHLELAIKNHPTALEPRLLLGRYYLHKGKVEQIAPLFTPLDDLQKSSPGVMRLQALAQLSQQENTKAELTLTQLIESTPDTAHYHHLLALAAAGSGDQRLVKKELHKALALDPDYVISLIALAKLARLERATAEFQQYMDKLLILAPEAPDVLRLRAVAAQDAGDGPAAIALASRAFASAPTTQSMLELATYTKAAGGVEEARRLQRDWVIGHPRDILALLALADDLRLDNLSTEMKTHYKAVLKLDPDNLIALNNLAWEIRVAEPQRALQYISHAADLAPHRADVLDSLAIIEHLNGDNRRASRNIQRALDKNPGNPSLLYHRAMIEAALGEEASAITILEKLLGDKGTRFPERAEAQALLMSLEG